MRRSSSSCLFQQGTLSSTTSENDDDLELATSKYNTMISSPPRAPRCSTPIGGLHNETLEGNPPTPQLDDTNNNNISGGNHVKPSPPLPMNFVEFITIPSSQHQDLHHHQHWDQGSTTRTSTTWSPSQRYPYPRRTPDASLQQRPFRLMPRSKTTLDRLSSDVTSQTSAASSPTRLRKRSAWSMSDAGEVATDELSVPGSPSTAALKHNLNRLSIHSPSCSSNGTYYESLRSSTPSFANKRSSTPPTIEGSPSSCFSKVISTSRQHRATAYSPRGESPSPKIVPLTVLTHDSPATTGKLPRRRQRLFPPQSPPEAHSLWSSDGSCFQQTTPDSSSSGVRLPKISLTPRRSPRRTIPKFPIASSNDESLSIESFLKASPPVVGKSILGPPTPTELHHSFHDCPTPDETIRRPDVESLSDDGDDDEFLLAFPSTLAEEKLARRSIKLRKTDNMLGDKTRSMTSMASSSCNSLRGIAFAPSDPSLYDMAGVQGSTEMNTEHQDAGHHNVGWVFDDADDHRESMVTPPICAGSSHPNLPPLARSTRSGPSLTHKPGPTSCSYMFNCNSPLESPPTSA